jgi:hypothetical protein
MNSRRAVLQVLMNGRSGRLAALFRPWCTQFPV